MLRRRALLAVLLALALGLHVLLVRGVFLGTRPPGCALSHDCAQNPPGLDFFAVYHGAIYARRGVSPYRIEPDGVTPGFYAFRYLPGVAQAARPLTRLPPERARLLWCAVIEATLLAVLVALGRAARDPWRWLLGAGFLLLGFPLVVELHMGQFTFVATALLVLGLLGPSWSPLFGLGVALKGFPLVAAPALLRTRRLWPQLALAVVLVAVAALPWFLARPDDARGYWSMNVAHLVPAYNAGNVGMINLVFQVWRLWGGGAFLPAWEHGVTLVRIAVLGATCLAVLGARERTPLLGASALLLAHFLTYPHVWEHHMSAVILLGAAWEATGLAGTRHRGAALVCLALLAAPLPSGLLALEDAAGLAAGHRHPLAPLLAALSKALPTLGLYGIAMRRLLAQGIAWPAHR